MPRKIPVGLIEQHPLAAPYLRNLLIEQGFRVYSEVAFPARADSPAKQIAIFIVDIGTLLVPLHTCLQQMKVRFPGAKILLIGDKLTQHHMLLLMRQGVHGFVRYAEVKYRVAQALRHVLEGKLRFPSEVVDQFALRGKMLRGRWGLVTKRERRILSLLEQGLSNKQAADVLDISENTIKFHLANIFRKLGVHDRQSAVVVSISRRLEGCTVADIGQANSRRPPVHSRLESRPSRKQSA